MSNRRGGFSVIRLGLFAGLIGVLLVVGGVITVLSDQQTRRSPLDIAAYPNAQFWGTSDVRETARNVFYRSADTPEAVAAYYQQKLNEHYGNRDQTCVRLPSTGNAPGSDTNPNIAPYVFRCIFDNSGFNTSQYTQVEIYPGAANPDPFYNAEGLTIVKYEQQWQR